MAKMLPLIVSCKGCPHHHYASARRYECTLADAIIPDSSRIPAFCPLSDYSESAARTSRIEETLRQMQAANDEKPFVFQVLLLIAAKLKTEIGHYGEIVIPIEGKPVFLRWDAITSISPADSWVEFFGEDSRKYRLYVGRDIELMVAKKVPPNDEELWTGVPLARQVSVR